MNQEKTRIDKEADKNIPHESARQHVSGSAIYIDDIREPHGTLYAYIFMAPHAKAKITHRSLEKVKAFPGIAEVVSFEDIPGENNVGPILHDEPLFAETHVEFHGQPLFAVAAPTLKIAYHAAQEAEFEFKTEKPVLKIEDALEQNSFVSPEHIMKTGNAAEVLKKAPFHAQATYRCGGQEHFYLEGQVTLAIPGENNEIFVYSSTQNPTEMQILIASILNLSRHSVTVETRRMGGGFGGKETQSASIACVAALIATKTGRPVKICLDRDDDMRMTGKRHPFLCHSDVGYDEQGRLLSVSHTLAAQSGFSADLTNAIVDRAMFHSDNAYYLPNAWICGKRCKTNHVSNTAFRGFGGPQGMLFAEQAIDDVARSLQKDPLDVRLINLYGEAPRNKTHYGQEIENFHLNEIMQDLAQSYDYRAKREKIKHFNQSNPILRQGIALVPVKFGISFTLTHMNQAGALIHVYQDGSIQLNHGGTEMGQGLFTKVSQIVAQVLQVDLSTIRCMATSTEKVPNTSPTAASSGTDLNGMAAFNASIEIKQRLTRFAAVLFSTSEEAIVFNQGFIFAGEQSISFAKLVNKAYLNRIPLSATGFYATPKIHYDRKSATGKPFYYFAYGAAASRVMVDSLTGEYELLDTEILHDCGTSLNQAIDLGQVEGAFAQGLGWLTFEELYWNEKGKLMTHAPSTYKIPTCRDIPEKLHVKFYHQPNSEDTIYKSKAVGEPPFMLGMAPFFAIKDAIASFASPGQKVILNAPATPEAVLFSIDELKESTL